MAEEKTAVQRYRKSPFVLDKAKLARILDILEQRFIEAELRFTPTFEITLKKGRKITTGGVDQVFGFDNSITNPITELTITAVESGEDSSENDLSCKLEFYNRIRTYIGLEVASRNSKRATQTFAELEEQVERTLISSWMYKLNVSNVAVWFGLMLVATLFVSLFFLPAGDNDNKNAFYLLSTDEINSFAQQSKTVTTTDDKINFLFALQSRQLERTVRKQPGGKVIRLEDLGRLLTVKLLFISLPVILIIVCLIYLRRNSYPNAVFMWGDWEEHFNKIVSMRRTIWTVIIAAFFVGVLTNLFVYGLSLR